MFELTDELLLYSGLDEDSVLLKLAELFRDWKNHACEPSLLKKRIFTEVRRLLEISTKYGFDENLWQDYLAFLLLTDENPFTLTTERVGVQDGSVRQFALHDFRIFYQLLHYDFSVMEQHLDLDCFSTLTHYTAIDKPQKNVYHSVSQTVRQLSRQLAKAQNEAEIFSIVTTCYQQVGVGMFGMNRAFRIQHNKDCSVSFLPIHNAEKIVLSDLIGYELQKQELIANTEAFLEGRPANNVLLYGDAGTGKSSCVKALMNMYYDRRLRIIELYKHQFRDLSAVIAAIKQRSYRFIIFIDDLSFEESEVEYKFLKAVIEGGVETRPDNILIYATSNRRHLIKETWKDKNDMEFENDIHRSDTMEEKLSLSARFGVTINFNAPNRQQYHDIVKGLAERQLPDGHSLSEEELLLLANRWEIRHGGVSGRTAQQFIHYLAGKEPDSNDHP